MYVTTREGLTRGKPMVSNCSQAMLPLVSVSRHWSTRSPISSPATGLPETRCASISLRVTLLPGISGLYPSPYPLPQVGERDVSLPSLAVSPIGEENFDGLPLPSRERAGVRVG